MPLTHQPYAPEYRRRIIELARAGRSINQLAREFEPSRHCQNRSLPGAPGAVGKRPAYGPGGSRCKSGISSIQASVWNVRTLFRMQREMTNG